jgi:hypothetical protein
MSSGRVPGPLGSGGNHSTIDDGTLQRSLSRVPGVIGTPTNVNAEHSVRPPLLPASRGAVKPPPTVQFGSRGPLVQRLQRLLNERLSPSPQLAINGNFDANTLAAVKQYQQHLRINVDGRVGRDTWYRLHKGDIATVPGAPKPVEKIIAPTKPNISAWTLEQKFSRVLGLTPPKLPGHMREEFMKLLDPTALAIIVGTLIVWAASHAFGVGVIVDIAMLIGGVVFIGMAAIDAAGHIYDFLTLTATADEESDLDQASVMLAKAVSILGVGAFAALVTKGAAKRGAKKTAPPEQKPLMKDPGPKVARDEPKLKPDEPAKKPSSGAAETWKIPPDQIKAMPHGTRPDPKTYMPEAQIKSQLAQFDDGASRFMTKGNVDKYGPAQKDGTSFVLTKKEADELLASTKGDKRALEDALGLPKNFLDSNDLVRVDIPDPKSLNVRIPSGNEAGANDLWLPGGKLPDGNLEAVVDLGSAPKGSWTSSPIKF